MVVVRKAGLNENSKLPQKDSEWSYSLVLLQLYKSLAPSAAKPGRVVGDLETSNRRVWTISKTETTELEKKGRQMSVLGCHMSLLNRLKLGKSCTGIEVPSRSLDRYSELQNNVLGCPLHCIVHFPVSMLFFHLIFCYY